MFAIPRNYKNSCPNIYLLLQARFKSKESRANSTSKNAPKIKALNHFDDFYASVFGKEWEPMREALFRRSKYVAVVNNYGDTDKTVELLSNRGAHCLKKLIKVQQDFNDEYLPKPESSTAEQADNRLEDYIERLQSSEVENIYPQNSCGPDSLNVNNITIRSNKNEKNNKKMQVKTKSTTMEQSLAEAEIDTSRIIDPSMGLTSESLYQYVPATQLKGMEDYVPESLHYSLYSKGKDFPLIIEPETNFSYPEHLKVYTYEMDSEWNTFPEPRRCETGVYNYYPMDCGSVLAVLALGLSPGDRVLDLCAAPGGKALVALQTLLPDIVVCNDASLSRVNRIHRVFGDYLHDFTTSNKWRERVLITNFDGTAFTDDQGFDKVLVDVPCTTDRKTLKTDGNNIFRPDRIRERLKMPELQAQLLTNALRLVRVGGAVVYSTCALSPVQNDGVVHAALKAAFEAHQVVAAVRDLTIPMAAFSSTLKLGAGASAPKYGQLVVPSAAANFGPTYLSRLVRLR